MLHDAVLNSSRLGGKLTSGKTVRGKKPRYIGFITEYCDGEKVWKPICTTVLVSQNIAASAGSCVKKIVKRSETYEDYKIHFDKNLMEESGLDKYLIKEVFLYDEYNSVHHNTNYTIDIGLIMVSMLIRFYSIYSIYWK